MAKRLALSHLGLPEGPLPDDLVLLGTWCLADRIDLTGMDQTRSVVRHPWLDGVRLDQDYGRIRALYECALANLACQLNAHHRVALSTRGWEIALGPWLRIFLNCVFERHMLLTEAARIHDIGVLLTVDHEVERTPASTAQFVLGVQDPYWNATFLADVAEQVFPRLERLPLSCESRPAIPEAKGTRRPQSLLNRLVGNVKALAMELDARLTRHRQVLFHRSGMQWREEFKLMLRLGLVPHMFLPSLEDPAIRNDDAVRLTLSLGLGASPEEEAMEKMFRHYLPRVFVEDFAAVRELILRRYPNRAKRIITGVAYYVDDYFKLYAAFATNAGARYTILQHGGGFGTPKINDEEELLFKTADEFVTWGWSGNEAEKGARTFPGASLWLSSLPDVEPDPSGMLLMPVSEWTLQTFRLFSAPLSFRQLEYLNDIFEFHCRLETSVAAHFRLRLQPNTRGWRVAERVKAAGLEHAILPAPGRFVSDLRATRLAVVNTNSTTLLEALCLNFPTVAILDPAYSPVRVDAQKAFDGLEQVGILYRTPEAAARFVSGVFSDPMRWWNDRSVQAIRNEFVRRFARREPVSARNLIARALGHS